MTAGGSEQGFTLIELIVVVAIMPLVIAAISVGLISVFSLQHQVSGSLTDAGDEQVVAASYQKDVQFATMITTDGSSVSPAPCGSGYQVLGLEFGTGGGTGEVSYVVAAQSVGSTTYDLTRNVCNPASTTPTTPTQSRVLARDVPASMSHAAVPPAVPPVNITCLATQNTACAPVPPTGGLAYTLGWVNPAGVTGITFTSAEPRGSYSYTLTAIPVAAQSSSSSLIGSVANPTPGIYFALPGTGTYATTLGFVDFTDWNSQKITVRLTCPAGALPMSAGIPNSPYAMQFCISVSTTHGGTPVTGAENGTCAIPGGSSGPATSGFNGITAVPFPTYSNPPSSEAFLGNNGFYTGVQGNPALYECVSGSVATVTFTNIAVVSSAGAPLTGWKLVTGDAESTDPGESHQWTSNVPLSLLPNSPNSPVGNACGSTPPSYNTTDLTGLPSSTTVKCIGVASTDKTGTVMLQASAPTTLTDTMVGTGLQGMFLGISLP